MDLGDASVIEELKLRFLGLTVLIGPFQLQVVACRDMVVLVGIDALENVVLFETQSYQLFQDHCIDGYLREADENSSCDTWQIGLGVPIVLSDL